MAVRATDSFSSTSLVLVFPHASRAISISLSGRCFGFERGGYWPVKIDTWIQRPREAALDARIKELEGEKAELRSVIEGSIKDDMIERLHYEAGKFDFALSHPLISMFTTAIAELFLETGAENYLEMQLIGKGFGWVDVTFKKRSDTRKIVEAKWEHTRKYLT